MCDCLIFRTFQYPDGSTWAAAKKGTAPSLQQGIAKKRLQADDLTVRTLLDWHREDGQTMAEYSIILAVITPAIVLAVSLLSDSVAARIGAVASLFP